MCIFILFSFSFFSSFQQRDVERTSSSATTARASAKTQDAMGETIVTIIRTSIIATVYYFFFFPKLYTNLFMGLRVGVRVPCISSAVFQFQIIIFGNVYLLYIFILHFET